MNSKFTATLCAVMMSVLAAPRAVSEETRTTARILVLTGNEYPGHKWTETAPAIVKFLSDDARLKVELNKDPNFLADAKLFDYDAIVLNYMNWKCAGPGEKARANLKAFVEHGKGLVLVHFACGAFQDWPEFKTIAGRVWDPKARAHDTRGAFKVELAKTSHPILQGLSSFETDDELYTCLTGEKEIEVLATARSKVDLKEYPMAFVTVYGKGRVFNCTLGHDLAALNVPEVMELYRRGTAWAAQLPAAPPAAAEKK
ncbi:MAG TPA: ThuA domain-containing protein [Planctomycetota bacterium]|nr:ThuA domain-containing protein [Planctomycetota bacterium]